MMLAYAANRPVAAERQSSPHTLLFILSAHVGLIAAVMSAKTDLPRRIQNGPPLIAIKLSPPPPARPQPPSARKPQDVSAPTDRPTQAIDVPPLAPTPLQLDPGPSVDSPAAGASSAGISQLAPPIATAPVHHDPRLLTPPSELKPPYPAAKLANEEEATLRLRVTINDRGRVVAVDPVNHADPVFLDAARRYMLQHWQYQPATEDSRPISATLVITLRFELDG